MDNNPWIVQLPKSHQPIPVGMYLADFMGVAPHALKDGSTRWRWAWRVMVGPLAGQEATALTDMGITANTLAGRLIEGLLGKPLKAGDNVQALVDGSVGKRYMLSVQGGPQGGKPGVKAVSQPPA